MQAALKKSSSVEVVFNLRQGKAASTGRMVVEGNKFFLTTPEMKVWFDGKTQWSYLHSAEEVNITTPTPQEVSQSNPLAILSSLDRTFTLRRVTAPAGVDKIEINPGRANSEFKSAVLTIDSSTSMPKELAIVGADGATTVITITKLIRGNAKPISTYRFNPKTMPNVEIVDLR